MSIIKPGPMPPFPKQKPEPVQRFANGFPVGKRTKKRQAVTRKLNKKHHIRECELKLPGCWRIVKLDWCHSKKSRFIVTEEDWEEAARGCRHCHDTIESWPHKKMEAFIKEVIAKRKPHAHTHDTERDN